MPSKTKHGEADGPHKVESVHAAGETDGKDTVASIDDQARVASAQVGADTAAQREAANDTAVDQARATEVSSTIKSYVIGAMTAGMVPVPVFDLAAVLGVQLKLIHRLTRIYGLKFNERLTKSIVWSLVGSIVPVTIGAGVGSALKAAFGLGTFIGTASVSTFAGAATYAIGRTFAQHFEGGGSLLDADMSAMKRVFKREYKKGKQQVAHETEGAVESPAT